MVQDELRSPGLIVVRTQVQGGTLDETLTSGRSQRAEPWPNVRIVLRGRFRAGLEELLPGDALVSTDYEGAQLRAAGPTVDVLRIAWRDREDSRWVRDNPHPEVVRGGHLWLEAARAVGDAIAGRSDEKRLACRALRPLLTLMASDRVFPTSEGHHVLTANTPHLRFGHALSEAFGAPTSRPMAVDLSTTLGCTERHALRLANDYFRTLHMSVRTWREYVLGMRLGVATLAMSSPTARTEDVSSWLGFACPSALCHSFAAAGLPSPGAIRDRLRASGETGDARA